MFEALTLYSVAVLHFLSSIQKHPTHLQTHSNLRYLLYQGGQLHLMWSAVCCDIAVCITPTLLDGPMAEQIFDDVIVEHPDPPSLSRHTVFNLLLLSVRHSGLQDHL